MCLKQVLAAHASDRAGSRPVKRGALPQIDPQALQKAAQESKDANKQGTPRATLDQRYRHRLANIRTKNALIKGLMQACGSGVCTHRVVTTAQVREGNGDGFIVHIIDDAYSNKTTEPQPVLLQVRGACERVSH